MLGAVPHEPAGMIRAQLAALFRLCRGAKRNCSMDLILQARSTIVRSNPRSVTAVARHARRRPTRQRHRLPRAVVVPRFVVALLGWGAGHWSGPRTKGAIF